MKNDIVIQVEFSWGFWSSMHEYLTEQLLGKTYNGPILDCTENMTKHMNAQ